MAETVAMACGAAGIAGIKVVPGSGLSNVFVVEDGAGVRFTVTVCQQRERRRV